MISSSQLYHNWRPWSRLRASVLSDLVGCRVRPRPWRWRTRRLERRNSGSCRETDLFERKQINETTNNTEVRYIYISCRWGWDHFLSLEIGWHSFWKWKIMWCILKQLFSMKCLINNFTSAQMNDSVNYAIDIYCTYRSLTWADHIKRTYKTDIFLMQETSSNSKGGLLNILKGFCDGTCSLSVAQVSWGGWRSAGRQISSLTRHGRLGNELFHWHWLQNSCQDHQTISMLFCFGSL